MRRLLVFFVVWFQVVVPAPLHAQGPRVDERPDGRGEPQPARPASSAEGVFRHCADGALAAATVRAGQGTRRLHPRAVGDAGLVGPDDRGTRGRPGTERRVPVLDLRLLDGRPDSVLGVPAQAEPGGGATAIRSRQAPTRHSTGWSWSATAWADCWPR